MNLLHAEEMTSIMGANVMNGNDPECRRWIQQNSANLFWRVKAGANVARPAAAATLNHRRNLVAM